MGLRKIAVDGVDWRVVLPSVRRALRGPRDEVEDAVHIAVEKLLAGERRFDAHVEIEVLIYNAARSVLWSERTRRLTKETFELQLPLHCVREEESPEAAWLRHEAHAGLCLWLEQSLVDDAEAQALCEVILDGIDTRREQAATLGWEPEHVDAVFNRAQRRLRRRGPQVAKARTSPVQEPRQPGRVRF